MSDLNFLKGRIKSVKSTAKITKAMQMVAVSKLRKARKNAEDLRLFSTKIVDMVSDVMGSGDLSSSALAGSGGVLSLIGSVSNSVGAGGGSGEIGGGSGGAHLLILVTSDKGLCGGLNNTVAKRAKALVNQLEKSGGVVKIYLIGKKGLDALGGAYKKYIVSHKAGIGTKKVDFVFCQGVVDEIVEMYSSGAISTASVMFNDFISTSLSEVKNKSLIPLSHKGSSKEADRGSIKDFEYEPSAVDILKNLLPRSMACLIYQSILENIASEFAARMLAMDNATRNATDTVRKLTISYNKKRQAAITSQLIDIVSGAQAT